MGTKNAVTVFGPYNIVDNTAGEAIATAIEAVDYAAAVKWIVVGPNTRGLFLILMINTA